MTNLADTSSSFFFQAEDGIRYGRVTGVQTCALPISSSGTSASQPPARPSPLLVLAGDVPLSRARGDPGRARTPCRLPPQHGRAGGAGVARPRHLPDRAAAARARALPAAAARRPERGRAGTRSLGDAAVA